jgi:hypothetical protein
VKYRKNALLREAGHISHDLLDRRIENLLLIWLCYARRLVDVASPRNTVSEVSANFCA